jgi:hypothetical protein
MARVTSNPGKAMSKRNAAAFAGALSLLLAACGSRDPAPAENTAVAPEANAPEASGPSGPAPPGASANGSVDAVPPPDAVSHPDGYLPPAPAEPDPAGANSSGAPATEDEYLRNRQAGR